MRVLVCGGRDCCSSHVRNWLECFGDRDAAKAAGISTRVGNRIKTIIHGAAPGADAGAAQWGEDQYIEVLAFPADWDAHGRAAGPIRNAKMIREGKPDLVIAFSGRCGDSGHVPQGRSGRHPDRHDRRHSLRVPYRWRWTMTLASDRLIRVICDGRMPFVAGFVTNGRIGRCAPILRKHLAGKTDDEARLIIARNRWQANVCRAVDPVKEAGDG